MKLCKTFNLNNYLPEVSLEGLILYRPESKYSIRKERRIIVVIPKESIDLSSLGAISKDDIIFNPIPIIYSTYYLDKYEEPFGEVTEVDSDLNIDFIENWVFKRYGWINPIADIPFENDKWHISIDDYRRIVQLEYSLHDMKHLEYYSIIPWEFIEFKLAIELCKLEGDKPEKRIKDLSNMISNSNPYNIVYKHAIDIPSYDLIDSDVAGNFDVSKFSHAHITDIRDWQ